MVACALTPVSVCGAGTQVVAQTAANGGLAAIGGTVATMFGVGAWQGFDDLAQYYEQAALDLEAVGGLIDTKANALTHLSKLLKYGSSDLEDLTAHADYVSIDDKTYPNFRSLLESALCKMESIVFEASNVSKNRF
jgi:hypothetical protein